MIPDLPSSPKSYISSSASPVPALATEIQRHAHNLHVFSGTILLQNGTTWGGTDENMVHFSPLSPSRVGARVRTSQVKEDLEHRSPSLWVYSSPWRADGRAGKADFPGGKRQQVSPLSSTSSFSLLKPWEFPLDKTPWASTEASLVKVPEKKQKTPSCSALPRDRQPLTCPQANSRLLPGTKEKSCTTYKLWVYFDVQLHRHFEKPHFGHRCVSAFVHLP